jgi:excisionase family DNA binding protein
MCEARLALTPDEAAALLGISRQSVVAAIRRNQIQACKVGRRWLIRREHLDDLLEGGAE